jgi:2-amino-4-hydroxy-6-hydroxymethyldihydropteridine diphosphokinase
LNAQTRPVPKKVLLGLGSNIDPEFHINQALERLGDFLEIVSRGSIWSTPAYGSRGADYLNLAVLAVTNLSQDQLKTEVLQMIEMELGRRRSENKYADRTIDIDLMIYDEQILDPELWTQPHVAIPAADVLPELKSPHTGETISQAAKRLLPGNSFSKYQDQQTDLS